MSVGSVSIILTSLGKKYYKDTNTDIERNNEVTYSSLRDLQCKVASV